MAKTVDELVIKMSVDGSNQLDQTNAKLDTLNENTKKTNTTLNGFQVRNVSAQIQDMAVQLEMGTNAFRVMGQQLPQLLSAFGTTGVVIGAVAAVALPLLQVGLKVAGVDMRNLQERTKDLTDSVNKFQDAQKANLPTLAGLGQTYGSMTGDAKAFFDVQQRLTEKSALANLSATLQQLKKDYQAFTPEAEKAAGEMMNISRGGSESALFLNQKVRSLLLGLTIDQAKEVASRLKDIDKATPEEAANRLNDVANYLNTAGIEAGKVKRFFEETVDPILKINNQILEMKKSMTEAAVQASQLNTDLLNIQNSFQPNINASKRNFDLVTAARKEGEMKIQEFTRQMREKTDKDQVDRSKEIAAFTVRTNQDVSDKIKDIAKGQYEAYRASSLTNDTKSRQLDLEKQIIDIKDKGLFDAEYNLKYDEDILRNAKEYNDTLQSIGEQRRKNIITAEQAKNLEKEAAGIRDKEDVNAKATRDAAVRAKIIKDEMENSRVAIEAQMASYENLGEKIKAINDKKIDIGFAQSLRGKSPLQQQILQIQEDARKGALEAGRAFAESFKDNGDGLTPERAQQLSEGLDAIAKGYRSIADSQISALQSGNEMGKGLIDAWDEYKSKALDTAGQVHDSFNNFTSGMEDAFVKFVQTGKLSFSDLANSVLADLARIAFKKAIVGLGGLFGFAAGGEVMANMPIIVGERGPELFVPSTTGKIVPNNQLGSGAGGALAGQTVVNYNIQAVDASSFRSLVARDPSFIYAVTEQGRRSQPARRAF